MTDSVDSQKAVAKPASHAKNDFEKDKYILRQLVTKDFKIKYRRSVLGVAWSVLNPLLMMVVMSIVFSTIFWSEPQWFHNARDVSAVPDCRQHYVLGYVRVDEPGTHVHHRGVVLA